MLPEVLRKLGPFEPINIPSWEKFKLPQYSNPNEEQRVFEESTRRINKLALDCVEGKPLFISTASLRGPFEKPWPNPWTTQEGKLQTEFSGLLHVKPSISDVEQQVSQKSFLQCHEGKLERRSAHEMQLDNQENLAPTRAARGSVLSESCLREIVATNEQDGTSQKNASTRLLVNLHPHSSLISSTHRVHPRLHSLRDFADAEEDQSPLPLLPRNAKLPFKISKSRIGRLLWRGKSKFCEGPNMAYQTSETKLAQLSISFVDRPDEKQGATAASAPNPATGISKIFQPVTGINEINKRGGMDTAKSEHEALRLTTDFAEGSEDLPHRGKKCLHCNSTESWGPWRCGPEGKKNLCNLCGQIWKQEKKSKPISSDGVKSDTLGTRIPNSRSKNKVKTNEDSAEFMINQGLDTISQPVPPTEEPVKVPSGQSSSFPVANSSKPSAAVHRKVMKKMFPDGVKNQARRHYYSLYKLIPMEEAHWSHLLTGPNSKPVRKEKKGNSKVWKESDESEQNTSAQAASLPKKEKRHMTFDTPEMHRMQKKARAEISEKDPKEKNAESAADVANVTFPDHSATAKPGGSIISLTASPYVSTQAAMLDAQEDFRKQLESTADDESRSFGKGSISTGYSLDERECNITPFRAFADGSQKSLDRTSFSLNTQDLFDAYTGINSGETPCDGGDAPASSPLNVSGTSASVGKGHIEPNKGGSGEANEESGDQDVYGSKISEILDQAGEMLQYWDVETELKKGI